MNILNLLEGLANAAPNSSEINELMNIQPENIRNAIKCNNSTELKILISSNQDYANETGVTLY